MPDAHAHDESVPRVAIQAVQGCIVVPIQIDLHDATLAQLRTDILHAIRRTGMLKIVLDLSGVALLDRFAFNHLLETRRTLALMGGRTIAAGIRAPVAACLVDLEVDLGDLEIAPSVEAALARFSNTGKPPARPITAKPGRPPNGQAQAQAHDPVQALLRARGRGSGP